MPRAAMVAYALARSSGVVSDTPRVKEPHASARVAIAASLLARKVMPSRWAMATACAGPVRCSSQTKYVLTERPYPVHMVRWPSIPPPPATSWSTVFGYVRPAGLGVEAVAPVDRHGQDPAGTGLHDSHRQDAPAAVPVNRQRAC